MALGLWTLADIKTKVRALTGLKSTNQLSDADLLSYINRYYQLRFPVEVQPLELSTFFSFDTVASTEEYDLTTQVDATTALIFEDYYITLEAPWTIAGDPIDLYLDPALFYSKFPESTTYDETQPTAVLWYQEKLLFRPTPDDAYTVKFASYRRPGAFSSDGDYPRREEWGYVIAYGTALEIVEDLSDDERVAGIYPLYMKRIAEIGRYQHLALTEQRPLPNW